MFARPDSDADPSRADLLDHLADLVAWLAANPDIPLSGVRVSYIASDGTGDDAAGIARVDDLAALVGGSVVRANGHHTLTRQFGGHISYEAFYIERATFLKAVAAHG